MVETNPNISIFFHSHQFCYMRRVYYDHHKVFGFKYSKIDTHFDIYEASCFVDVTFVLLSK